MVEAAKHPNIEILSYTEVLDVKGVPGSYKVKLLKKPRYVDEKKCTGCGSCTEVCPVAVPDEFNYGLGYRKAIYIPFPQAVPKVALISMDDCIQCKSCEKECRAGAIDYEQKPTEIELTVGSIIVATGFEIYDIAKYGDYGYGRFENVITQIELERMLSPTGPTGGMLVRVSDGKHPKRVAMIQCVGSRDVKRNPYCSEVCCMVAVKNAKIIKQESPDTEVIIFYMDIRGIDEGHEEYYLATREYGVVFVRGRVAEVIEDPETKNLKLLVENTLTGELLETEVDLLVLSAAVVPSEGTNKIAQILGLNKRPSGFLAPQHVALNPQETKNPGIYICGAALGPKNIPYAVSSARAAAAAAAAWTLSGEVAVEMMTPEVNEELCVGCRRCERTCPFGAIKVVDGKAVVSEIQCKGCGACVASCPAHALDMRYYRDKQIIEEIKVAVRAR